MSDAPDEQDLHGFIDGELTRERRAEVQAAIARDPALDARVRALQADKAALVAAYAPLAHAPPPPVLLRAARTPPARPAIPRRGLAIPRRGLAVLAAALAAGVLLTVTRRAPDAPLDPAIAEALATLDRSRQPLRRLDDPASLATADQVISSALGGLARAPDLQHAGFTLVSAEIYGRPGANPGASPGASAVQLRYEDRARRPFTVYLRASDGPDAFEVTQRGALRICLWRNADVAAVMTGQMSAPELFRLASMAYSSLGL